jgi:prolyl oligopeptidase
MRILVPAILATLSLAAQAPPTRTVPVVDDYFGTQVADPYRWLEDDHSVETKAWVAAQNQVTGAYLDAIPERGPIRARLASLWNYEKFSAPFQRGSNYFYRHNSGVQNQWVMYVTRKLGDPGRVLIDPNALSADGTVSLAGVSPSEDGRLLAYKLSKGGSDVATWRIREVATGRDLADSFPAGRMEVNGWSKDGKGFYYTDYPAKSESEALTAVYKNQKLYFHKLGTPAAQDTVVFERPDQPDWGFGAEVSEDGRFLVIQQDQGTERKNRVFLKPAGSSRIIPLFDKFDGQYDVLGNDGDTFYVHTDFGAPRGHVVAVDLRHPEPSAWREIIPQAAGRDVIAGVTLVGKTLAVTWKIDALNQVRMYDLHGKQGRSIQLPGLGNLDGFSARRKAKEVFYTFTSFNVPTTIYRYDLKTGQSSVFRQPKVDFQPDAFEVSEVFYPSKDGTKVPLFLAHRKGLRLDGSNPTLLYGYGGFNIAMAPSFSVANLVWMEMGGVYAMACLRGGNEYGKDWWEAGKRETKQNVFDDFIAAGEYLIQHKVTSTPKLAIFGGSNGGLLVGACLTQRPDLWGAAVPEVGVLDMLRYHKFTIGWMWQSDYMTSDTEAGFCNLIKYSPRHNIKPGTAYPPTLVLTGDHDDHDDRVVPAHSHKFTATLQAAQAGPAPILTRIETNAGHGTGNTSKTIQERADTFAFLVKSLHMSLPAGFPGAK